MIELPVVQTYSEPRSVAALDGSVGASADESVDLSCGSQISKSLCVGKRRKEGADLAEDASRWTQPCR